MSARNKMNIASRSVAILTLLGLAASGFTQIACAFSGFAASGDSEQKHCEFSLELQQSAAVRKQYLAKLIAATGEVAQGVSAVDDMYRNVKKASYSVGDSADGEDQSVELSDLWGGRTKKAARVGIDALSMDCLGCHDGSSASSVSADLRNNPYREGMMVNSFSSDHPIGMDYRRYVNAGKGYKPVMLGSTKMIFVDGKVGCLTCHDPLNQEKGHLVMSDRHSALCGTCHNK